MPHPDKGKYPYHDEPYPPPYCAPVFIDGNQYAVGVHPCEESEAKPLPFPIPPELDPDMGFDSEGSLDGTFDKEFSPELSGSNSDSSGNFDGIPGFSGGDLPKGPLMSGDSGSSGDQLGTPPNGAFF